MDKLSEKKTITADRPCPITGSSECEIIATKAREGHALRNVISVESGLIYVDPLPIEDLEKFYKEDYRKSYKNVFVPKGKHISRAGRVAGGRFSRIADIVRPGMRTLDIGAGGGEFAALMKQIGCEAFGIEPNKGYGSFANENYGVDLFLGMYQEADFERGSFDVLTLFQVLEHLADPVEDVRRMSEYLKTGGKFIIEVPDILFPGMHFDHKWHDGHLFGFSTVTLEAVGAKAGLRLEKMLRMPGNLYAVFEKTGDTGVDGPSLEGHFEAAREELFDGRSTYWKMPTTYTKIFTRLPTRIGEYISVARNKTPRKILDAALRRTLETRAIT